MDFRLHKDFSEIDRASWNALAEQSIADTPFSRHEYLREWWKTLGGGEWKSAELVLISARENDELIGIAPLFIADYEGQRALMLVVGRRYGLTNGCTDFRSGVSRYAPCDLRRV